MTNLEMWPFHNARFSSPDLTIRTHYSDLLETNEELARAVGQLETARRAIEGIMEELIGEEILSAE